jgi:nicotinate-nucleotide adenylyltransferase
VSAGSGAAGQGGRRNALSVPPAFPGMRIGLLGGSFNPAHEGHLHISRVALARLGLHAVWWLVTPGNPLKDASARQTLPQRLTSARAAACHPRIRVTAFEAARGSPFTADTLAFLLRRHKGVHFVWIMGGDNLAQFHRWRDWRRIFAGLPIFVLDRPGARLPAIASPAARSFAAARLPEEAAATLPTRPAPAWIYAGLPLSPLSSTAIRACRKP